MIHNDLQMIRKYVQIHLSTLAILYTKLSDSLNQVLNG